MKARNWALSTLRVASIPSRHGAPNEAHETNVLVSADFETTKDSIFRYREIGAYFDENGMMI